MPFNCFNSVSFSSNARMRHSFSQNSGHTEFLRECLTWLSSVNCSSSRQRPCLLRWKMTINTLLQLWSDLHTEYQLSYLLTNRLNQACIKTLFLIIRGKGEHRDKPDVSQFCTALLQLMVGAALVPSPRANCEEDVYSFLLTLRSINHSGENATRESVVDPVSRPMPELLQSVKSLLSVISIRESPVSAEERNVAAYIEGFICLKIRDKLRQNCMESLCSNLDLSNKVHRFVSRKTYEGTGGGEELLLPSDTFQNLLEEFKQEIRSIFQNIIHINRVRYRLVSARSRAGTSLDCSQCQRKALIVHLFVTIRLNHFLR